MEKPPRTSPPWPIVAALLVAPWSLWAGWELSSLLSAERAARSAGFPDSLGDVPLPPVPASENTCIPLESAERVRASSKSRWSNSASMNVPVVNPRVSFAEDEVTRLPVEREMRSPEFSEFLENVVSASRLPKFRPPRDYSMGHSVDLGPAACTLDAAKLLLIRSRFAASDGDQKSASADTLAMSRLSNLMLEDNLVITALVEMSLGNLSSESAQSSIGDLGSSQFVPADWADLERSRERIALLARPCAVRAIASDARVMTSYVFERTETGPSDLLSSTSGASPHAGFMLVYRTGFLPLFYLDKASYLRGMLAIHTAVKDDSPATALLDPPAPPLPESAIFSRLMLPVLENLPAIVSIFEVRMKLSQVGLALEKYRFVHVSYPESLRGLDLPPSMIKDPFSSGDFVYRPSGENLLIYSVGLDRIDQAGHPSKNSRGPGDLAWKIIRTPPAPPSQAPQIQSVRPQS